MWKVIKREIFKAIVGSVFLLAAVYASDNYFNGLYNKDRLEMLYNEGIETDGILDYEWEEGFSTDYMAAYGFFVDEEFYSDIYFFDDPDSAMDLSVPVHYMESDPNINELFVELRLEEAKAPIGDIGYLKLPLLLLTVAALFALSIVVNIRRGMKALREQESEY